MNSFLVRTQRMLEQLQETTDDPAQMGVPVESTGRREVARTT